jgi:hypothetical protein
MAGGVVAYPWDSDSSKDEDKVDVDGLNSWHDLDALLQLQVGPMSRAPSQFSKLSSVAPRMNCPHPNCMHCCYGNDCSRLSSTTSTFSRSSSVGSSWRARLSIPVRRLQTSTPAMPKLRLVGMRSHAGPHRPRRGRVQISPRSPRRSPSPERGMSIATRKVSARRNSSSHLLSSSFLSTPLLQEASTMTEEVIICHKPETQSVMGCVSRWFRSWFAPCWCGSETLP